MRIPVESSAVAFATLLCWLPPFRWLTMYCAPQSLLQVVAFGDSMTDNGNGTYLATGKTWPSDPAYDRGRFSNGLVWAEVLADRLALPIDDMAHGGATADNKLVQGSTGPNYTIPVPSLLEQVDHYLGHLRHPGRTVFILNIGGNDLFFDPDVDPRQVSKRLVQSVDRLLSRGARKVMVAGPGPSVTHPLFGPTIVAELRRAQRERSDRMMVFDMHQALIDLLARAAKLNITHTHQPCLTGTYNASQPRTLCTDPDNYFFFDDFHPTAYVHRLLGLKAFETVRRADESLA